MTIWVLTNRILSDATHIVLRSKRSEPIRNRFGEITQNMFGWVKNDDSISYLSQMIKEFQWQKKLL